MSGNVLRPCDCASKYQDAKYGKGNRVHTVGKEANKLTCTVCGRKKIE